MVSSIDPASLAKNNDDGVAVDDADPPSSTSSSSSKHPLLSDEEKNRDNLDPFNHPRIRRLLILQELFSRQTASFVLSESAPDLSLYRKVHSEGLMNFLETCWSIWADFGADGRDLAGCMKTLSHQPVPPLVFTNVALPRSKTARPSKHPMGQIGYYCTDICTPLFHGLMEELRKDAGTIQEAVSRVQPDTAVYAITTHPGHHAATDAFGGYCYVNHAALAARLLQETRRFDRVAVLDVDYHAGNGTAEIFEKDPSVLAVSIHCDPDYDYPFHSGFADEIGLDEGEGTTLNIPLAPGATWETTYQPALLQALSTIERFNPEALVISLGLDTYNEDPCAIRRAGFQLEGEDYCQLGETIAKLTDVPTVIIQEGGYRMDRIAVAASDVVTSFAAVLDKKFGKGTVKFGQ